MHKKAKNAKMPTIAAARQWYAQDDPVHGFDHVLRVYGMAEHLAQAEGADLEIVRAAALLHDAGDEPGLPQDASGAQRRNHQHNSAEFAGEVLRGEGWEAERVAAVQHCIRAHRFRDSSEPPRTREAQVLFDADKLDAIGAVGVARAIAHSAAHGLPFYCEPSDNFLKTSEMGPGEVHSAYHEYLFKLVKLKDQLFTSTALGMASERHAFMEAYFQQLAAEVRAEK